MTMFASLRAALRPVARRLRALTGEAPPRPKPAKAPPPPVPAAAPAAAKGGQGGAGRKPAPKGQATVKGKAGVKGKPGAGGKPKAKPAAPAPEAAPDRRPRRKSMPPISDKPWNILFLGGSNTVMRHAYPEGLVAALGDRIGAPGKSTNLAVGGNSIVHGLMLAKLTPDLADYDIVVIEYGVNDPKLAKPEGMEAWKGAAEGLLRHLFATRPDVHVVFVQFHGRDVDKPFKYRPAEETIRLVQHYARSHAVSFVDIDHLLRNVLFRDPAEFAALYEDKSHFERPQVARLIGAIISANILGAPARPGGALPPPLYPWHFAEAEVVELVPDPAAADRVFSNSRFQMATRRIAPDGSLSLDLPGPILAVEYVSTNGGATLRIGEPGVGPFTFHTRHASVGAGRFTFLFRCRTLESGRSWATRRRGPVTATLQALADAPPDELVKAPQMLAAEPGAAEGVFVARLLCTP